MMDALSISSAILAALWMTILTADGAPTDGGAAGGPATSPQGSASIELRGRPMRVLLIGASIGRKWDFGGLPERVGLRDVACEYIGHFEFDKTPALAKGLEQADTRPDVVIFKECSAYFPRDLAASEEMVRGWVLQCRDRGVIPVLSTVAPVTKQKSLVIRMKQIVKRILGRPGRNQQIAKYNDWVHQYASAEGLEVLDLEGTLRVSDSNRVLREDLAAPDGLHLNARAYELLDRTAAELLARLATETLVP